MGVQLQVGGEYVSSEGHIVRIDKYDSYDRTFLGDNGEWYSESGRALGYGGDNLYTGLCSSIPIKTATTASEITITRKELLEIMQVISQLETAYVVAAGLSGKQSEINKAMDFIGISDAVLDVVDLIKGKLQ